MKGSAHVWQAGGEEALLLGLSVGMALGAGVIGEMVGVALGVVGRTVGLVAGAGWARVASVLRGVVSLAPGGAVRVVV